MLLYFLNNIRDEELDRRSRRALWVNAVFFLMFFLAFVYRTLVAPGPAVEPNTGYIYLQPYKYLSNLLQMPLVLSLV